MTDKVNIDALRKELGADKIDKLLNIYEEQENQKKLDAETKAMDERMQKFVDAATGEQREALEKAAEMITMLDETSKKSAELFASTVEQLQEQIAEQSTEIKTLMARREGRDLISTAVGKTLRSESDIEQLMEEAAFVKALTRSENIEDTKFGAEVVKAVNDASSIEVSSESYETVFSSRILRDIQARLVVGNLFTELPMESKLLTMQIEADRSDSGATWVEAGGSVFGTDASTGNEHTTALTDVTFKTFKLACNAHMTDETSEDAITPLLGIIRRRLVEAHAEAIEKAFLNGAGTTGVPKGLTVLANASNDNTVLESAASGATATSKVTALELHKLRRLMGRKGTRISDLVLIVSLDVYYDIMEDEAFADMDQVGASAMKLQGQVGRIYGMPVVVSEYFADKAASAPCAVMVYTADFVVPRQRGVTTEYERIQKQQKDVYYVTQRLNLQRYFGKGTDHANVAMLTYAA
ncbi:major head protein [Vibrio phage D51]